MDGKQSKAGQKKKKRTFNFSKKQKLTSESTTSSTTNDATATATTQRSTERDRHALTTELRELSNNLVWGGRRKPLSKVPVSKVPLSKVDKTGLGEVENQKKNRWP